MNDQENVVVQQVSLRECLVKTFFQMFLGLIATALIAFATYQTGLYMTIATGISYPVLAIIEVVVVLVFSLLFRKLPPIVVSILYYVYAIINGVTMGVIFAVYEISTIALAFLITSFLFGALALYGYKTKRDISKASTILLFGLFLALVVSVINLFIGNTIIDIALTWIVLAIFCGLTIYDIYKIKNTQELYAEIEPEKLHVYYAMDLYLDFINIFLKILSILGRRRD